MYVCVMMTTVMSVVARSARVCRVAILCSFLSWVQSWPFAVLDRGWLYIQGRESLGLVAVLFSLLSSLCVERLVDS